MSFPKVSVQYSNNNLLKSIDAIDGICGLSVTVATGGLIGLCQPVYSLQDAIDKGYTLLAEAFAYKHISEFYNELGGNQELWIMGTAETVSMAQSLLSTDETAAVKLLKAAEGKVRLLGVARKPAVSYNPGTVFMDTDVTAAITAALTFCQAQLAALRPQIKLGKVANGPLSITDAFIGTKNIKVMANLEALHDKGFISFMKHPQKAGIYFGIDHMASTDDYRLLAYGRVVDKAAVIAAATYVEEIENDVDVDPVTGYIDELDIKHLEGTITQQINVGMGDQISGLVVIINPAQNIINTSTLTVQLRIIPKGYTSYIIVDLGLKAPVAA